jgi:hypothetical protein
LAAFFFCGDLDGNHWSSAEIAALETVDDHVEPIESIVLREAAANRPPAAYVRGRNRDLENLGYRAPADLMAMLDSALPLGAGPAGYPRSRLWDREERACNEGTRPPLGRH